MAPGWLPIPAWAASGPWEDRTIAPTNLAVGVALSQLLPTQPNTKTSHQSQSQSAALPAPRATSLQDGAEEQLPHLMLLPGKGGEVNSQQRLLQINPPYKSCIDAFYTLRVKKIFKSCEPDVPISPLKMPILLFLTRILVTSV